MIDERCSMTESYNTLLKNCAGYDDFEMIPNFNSKPMKEKRLIMKKICLIWHPGFTANVLLEKKTKIASNEMKQYKNDLLVMMLRFTFH